MIFRAKPWSSWQSEKSSNKNENKRSNSHDTKSGERRHHRIDSWWLVSRWWRLLLWIGPILVGLQYATFSPYVWSTLISGNVKQSEETPALNAADSQSGALILPPETFADTSSSPPAVKKQKEIKPRVLHIVADRQAFSATTSNSTRHRSVPVFPAEWSDITQSYPNADSSDAAVRESMRRSNFSHHPDPDCVLMAPEWQATFHPTCNSFHEIDSIHDLIIHIGEGSWRDAWELHEHPLGAFQQILFPSHFNDSTITTEFTGKRIVLKTWRFEHNMEEEYYELNRVDAVAMERLTSSKHILNMYAFCGLSIITEYAKRPVTKLADHLVSLGKLRLFKRIVRGLADIHALGHHNHEDHHQKVVALVHNDVNTEHIVIDEDNVPRFYDFNIAQLMMWHQKTHEPCGFGRKGFFGPQWRSPEEVRSYNDLPHELMTEKVDIYALGNIAYRFITGTRVWRTGPGSINDESRRIISQLKYNGTKPELPKKYYKMSKDDLALEILIRIMNQCFEFHPNNRPSAEQIIDELNQFLVQFKQQ